MRLLVFEFITGGGFINQPLPQSLLQEGHLMRNALLDDLCSITDLELLVLQDERLILIEQSPMTNLQYLIIAQEIDLHVFLSARQTDYDAVWLIAPETEGILVQWCQFFSQQGKYLYTSSQQAVTICQDKLATSEKLQTAGIACVPSHLYDLSLLEFATSWVIKANDSVGCDQVYLIESEQDWKNVLPGLQAEKTYIIQPYITGQTLSLSCLFNQGKAYYICCNQQHTYIEQQQFVLSACTVNIQDKNIQIYHALCQQIADAIPQLFGYVGIDFIETEAGENLILEINPRLTTSYAGIKAALGLNLAELVINLPNEPPELKKIRNQQVLVDIEQGYAHAS
ncbi:conserved hypothetical protein [Bathymodiolus platifrons methanotrophic gill symbiont]|uniref:ATP-grasp domain-containing protein n=1 Tax=Bathymodiolus platifrons methanotrophic gill symbiont TaxID=113268 RepID=UPI000B760E25|nr:ATP-grasp domain-containing protein [Bathymodiolus platifrons methanotrophic gill symbiont]MCK5869548.1 ATP-grasp domain-containing protein [Methyloprofundus sp.]GAW84831.1 conserved hypothetical protein [Bathymodiolus platifrons methanotrophic gill symbiont]GFO74818.1 tyramine---L-glutamate ligase [Bathymodiolus platifrons methanotrophic gill symbiont]